MIVEITLTSYGSDVGPFFDLYSNLDGYAIAFDSGVPKADLIAGYTATVPDGATTIRIQSTGVCESELFVTIEPAITTTSTTTTEPVITTTSTSTVPPLWYTWYITEGTSGNCGDNVGSTPYYSITNVGADVTEFYIDTDLLTVYNAGGVGLISLGTNSGGLAEFRGALDTPTAISYIATC